MMTVSLQRPKNTEEDTVFKATLHLITITAVIASGPVFGQPNDFAEQLILTN